MEASEKTPINIGRNACRLPSQLYFQFKQIVLTVNKFLILCSLPRIKGYMLVFTLFYKLRKLLTINDLRKHTNRLREGFTVWRRVGHSQRVNSPRKARRHVKRRFVRFKENRAGDRKKVTRLRQLGERSEKVGTKKGRHLPPLVGQSWANQKTTRTNSIASITCSRSRRDDHRLPQSRSNQSGDRKTNTLPGLCDTTKSKSLHPLPSCSCRPCLGETRR